MKMTLGKGCTIEEARDWTIVGCIQPGPGGGSTDGLRTQDTSTWVK